MSYIGNEPIVSATRTVTEITATAGQTVFTANGGYTVGFIDVFVNGSQLTASDFTATNGSTITLNEAATVNDIVRLVAWGTFQAANITSGSLSAGGITWSQAGGVTLPRIDSTNEGGQLNFNRASDNTATWSIDSFGNTSTPSLRFLDGANVRMTIDGSGNVGIGTSSPNERFEVLGLDDTRIRMYGRSGILSNSFTSNIFYNGSSWVRDVSGGCSGITLGSTSDPSIVFHNTTATSGLFTERMRIASTGDVYIGTTSTAGSAATLTYLRKGGVTWQVGPTASTGNYAILNSGDAGVFIVNGNTSWSANSDERIKTPLIPFTNAVQKVCSLRAGTGRYLKDDESVSRSFLIAQDVQKVLPEAVDVQNDEQGTLALAYTDLIPLLTAAIQELKSIVDNQKIELDNAKAEIELLKGAN